MHINIVTLFPEYFQGPLDCGLMRRARESGLVSFSFLDPREQATDKHRSVDDRPYGGGPGMVMLAGPLAATLRGLGFCPENEAPGRLLLLTPSGRPFDQRLARELAAMAHGHNAARPDHNTVQTGNSSPGPDQAPSLTLICGRYEGIDARLEELFPLEPVSVGDFVLNGGEAGALCLIEAVCRLRPGFMGHEGSGEEESFSSGLLEYPHYTRPEDFEGLRVPGPLLSGDHGHIALWRRQMALARTLERRPDLLDKALLDADDLYWLKAFARQRAGRNLYCGLVHQPVLDRDKNSVTVSLTNLDIHDIARSSCTYGLGGYYVITPLNDQRQLLQTLLGHWLEGSGKRSNPDRGTALGLVRDVASISEAIEAIERRCGRRPQVFASSATAHRQGPPGLGWQQAAEALDAKPVLLLLGTGQGLAPEALELCDAVLPPLRPADGYNHLSVRSAAAIIFDRLLGDWR